MMFWYGNGGWAWWQVAIMWIVMIAFWGVLIWAVWALVTGALRRTGGGDRDVRQSGRAAHILDERLARGEIGAEEYQRLRELMGRDQGSRPASVRDTDGDQPTSFRDPGGDQTLARPAHRTGSD